MTTPAAREVLRAAWVHAQGAGVNDPDAAIDALFEALKKAELGLEVVPAGIRLMRVQVNAGYIRVGQAGAPVAECGAVRTGDGTMECRPCALAWDENDPEPRPPCAPATFERLARAAIDAALEIEGRQRALVARTSAVPALREFRYRPALTRAAELRAAAAAIEKFHDLWRQKQGGRE